jgi:hypothetical protein
LLQNGQVLVAGGAPYISTAEIFDSSLENWFAISNMRIERYSAGGVTLQSGQVLVAGEAYGEECDEFTCYDLVTASAEIYSP